MPEPIPPDFDAAFLDWFKERTENAWASYQTRDFTAARAGGSDWQRGTRWLSDLSEAEIDAAEGHWSVRFPPDYRLFLSYLHTVDRPMAGARFVGHRLLPAERPSFYDWQHDAADVQRAFDWPLEGLLFDIELNRMWLPS